MFVGRKWPSFFVNGLNLMFLSLHAHAYTYTCCCNLLQMYSEHDNDCQHQASRGYLRTNETTFVGSSSSLFGSYKDTG